MSYLSETIHGKGSRYDTAAYYDGACVTTILRRPRCMRLRILRGWYKNWPADFPFRLDANGHALSTLVTPTKSISTNHVLYIQSQSLLNVEKLLVRVVYTFWRDTS